MKIYVAGKISGLPRLEVETKFQEARKTLADQGHSVFVPTVLPAYDDVTHDDYMKICYAMIDVCDAVFVLKDWQKSKGARMEVQYAADWRKEIIYEDPATREQGFPIVYGNPVVGQPYDD